MSGAHALACRECVKVPERLGPPVERLEQGNPILFLSVVYSSRGTLPKKRIGTRAVLGDLGGEHVSGILKKSNAILSPPGLSASLDQSLGEVLCKLV